MVGWLDRLRHRQRPDEPELKAPLVILTPAAHQQLAVVLGRQAQPAALRIMVKNPGAGPPQYDMALEAANVARAGDSVVDVNGLRILVDAQSMPSVDGATVDFRHDPLQPGFIVHPPVFAMPAAFDGSDPLAAEVESVLEQHVNPGIAAHGGHASLVGVKDDVVYVAMGGGCQGCSMAAVTLKQGIEQILKQTIPRIRAVVDATDHALGSNPFYTPDKAGESPFHQAAKA
jgi:Fe/S biogenesis protein NfuA